MSREESPAGLSPAAAFALLGHEDRVSILHELLTASRDDDEYPASFATLHDRTDIEASSKFSYHLDTLTGQFIRQTEDGYELRYAGWEIATSILAGTYNERAAFGPTPIEGVCPTCSERGLQASYHEEWLTVHCRSCERQHCRYPVPPGAIHSRSIDEICSFFDRYIRSDMTLAREGICPGCTGTMSVKTNTSSDQTADDRVVVTDCQRCGNRLYPPLGLFFIEHEQVEQFFLKHGRSLQATPFWEYEFCVSDERVTVSESDPWRCQLAIEVDDERLVLSIGANLTIESIQTEQQ